MNVSNLPKEARTAPPANHPPVANGRVGVLIVNLGTPEGTDYWSIRRYLQEFLSDRRVIETPRVIWAPILQAILLRRPHTKGRAPGRRATQGASGRGLRPHSRHSPLPAILRRLDGDGRRQDVRSAAVHALAARDSRRRALLRRSGLYRCACPLR